MFCPQCSQQQISEEMRFCSRCGFSFTGVRELIATGGLTAAEMPPKRSRAMKGVRQGTWIMSAALLLSLFVGLLTAADDDFAVLLLIPVLCFLIGFVRLLIAVFVQDRAERKPTEAQHGVSAALLARAGRNMELPASRLEPVSSFTPNKRTAEVVQPPSVTENTTKLLDD